MNKRGQDLSIGTLILIVLGIVVLVLLILGFSLGWSNLLEKINIFGGSGSSIQSVISACNLATASNSKYTYCQDFKKIKVDGKTEYLNCQDLRVAGSLDSTLDCDQAQIDAATSGTEYCKILNEGKKIPKDTKVKVNNIECASTI